MPRLYLHLVYVHARLSALPIDGKRLSLVLQIPTWIRTFLLLVSHGTRASWAFAVTIRSPDVSIQLHWKSSIEHQNITERYVLVHILGTSLRHIDNNIHERVTFRARRHLHGRTKFLHRLARPQRHRRRRWWYQCRRLPRDVVTKSKRRWICSLFPHGSCYALGNR